MFLCRALVISLSLGCAAMSGQTAGVDPSRQPQARLVPETMPVEVTPAGTASFYTPDTLYQYMDGGADIFLVYGVHMLLDMDIRAGAT